MPGEITGKSPRCCERDWETVGCESSSVEGANSDDDLSIEGSDSANETGGGTVFKSSRRVGDNTDELQNDSVDRASGTNAASVATYFADAGVWHL